jgi:hypothetical protein
MKAGKWKYALDTEDHYGPDCSLAAGTYTIIGTLQSVDEPELSSSVFIKSLLVILLDLDIVFLVAQEHRQVRTRVEPRVSSRYVALWRAKETYQVRRPRLCMRCPRRPEGWGTDSRRSPSQWGKEIDENAFSRETCWRRSTHKVTVNTRVRAAYRRSNRQDPVPSREHLQTFSNRNGDNMPLPDPPAGRLGAGLPPAARIKEDFATAAESGTDGNLLSCVSGVF